MNTPGQCAHRKHSNGPAQPWCAAVLLTATMLYAAAALADAPSQDPSALRLPAGSTRSALGAAWSVYGLPLRIETFDSPVDLPATVETIARQLPAPPSLLVQAGTLVLAWQSGPHHWVVRLAQARQASASRTHGTVSVLTLPDGEARQTDAHAAPAWLPADAPLRFVLDDAGGAGAGEPLRHSVYTHDWPPSHLWPLLQERLRLAGWLRESGVDKSGLRESGALSGAVAHRGALHYTRGSRRLTLVLVAVSGGSGVLAFEAAR